MLAVPLDPQSVAATQGRPCALGQDRHSGLGADVPCDAGDADNVADARDPERRRGVEAPDVAAVDGRPFHHGVQHVRETEIRPVPSRSARASSRDPSPRQR
jgi:hypothetical protein